MQDNKSLAGALSAITAAVVGVILNLSIWFAIHTLFREVIPVHSFGLSFGMPVLSSVDIPALVLAVSRCGRDFPIQYRHALCAGRIVSHWVPAPRFRRYLDVFQGSQLNAKVLHTATATNGSLTTLARARSSAASVRAYSVLVRNSVIVPCRRQVRLSQPESLRRIAAENRPPVGLPG